VAKDYYARWPLPIENGLDKDRSFEMKMEQDLLKHLSTMIWVHDCDKGTIIFN
jgi:hypothetical protein